MLLRVILWAMVAYIAYRVVQLTMRIMSSGKRKPPEDDPFAPGPPKPPSERFKNIEDADFEDITPHEPDSPPKPPEGS
jgi:hypothetical protein